MQTGLEGGVRVEQPGVTPISLRELLQQAEKLDADQARRARQRHC